MVTTPLLSGLVLFGWRNIHTDGDIRWLCHHAIRHIRSSMATIYYVEVNAGETVDVLQNESTGVRVCICRTGAEMVSLARLDAQGAWTGFLVRDNDLTTPADGWANHATVMGYFLHRLWKEQSNYERDIIRGGNHGFLRHFQFGAPTFDANESSLTYEVLPAQIPADAYPRPVACWLTYALHAEGVRVRFRFENQDASRPAHVSFGIHPGFSVSSVTSAEVELPAGKYIRHFAPGNFLDGRVEEIQFAGGPMPFDKSKLEDSYIVGIEEVCPRNIILRDAGRVVTLDFSEVPYMTLWSSADDFICIEPCWGLPDSNPQKPFEQKDGIQIIPPGGMLEAAFGIAACLEP